MPTPKLPKMAVDKQEHHGNSTPGVLGVPHNATPSPVYLGTSPQPEPTTALFIIISLYHFKLIRKIKGGYASCCNL